MMAVLAMINRKKHYNWNSFSSLFEWKVDLISGESMLDKTLSLKIWIQFSSWLLHRLEVRRMGKGGATSPLGQMLTGGENVQKTLIYIKTNPQAQALRWWWVRYTQDQNGTLCFFSGNGTRMAQFTYSLADTEHGECCASIFMRGR